MEVKDWREGLSPKQIFDSECLGRWVVNHNGCDGNRIAAFIKEWTRTKRPVAMNDWFLPVVREQYSIMRQSRRNTN